MFSLIVLIIAYIIAITVAIHAVINIDKANLKYMKLWDENQKLELKLVASNSKIKNHLSDIDGFHRKLAQNHITIKNLEKALAKYENDDLKNGKYKLKKQDKPRRDNGQFKAKGEK